MPLAHKQPGALVAAALILAASAETETKKAPSAVAARVRSVAAEQHATAQLNLASLPVEKIPVDNTAVEKTALVPVVGAAVAALTTQTATLQSLPESESKRKATLDYHCSTPTATALHHESSSVAAMSAAQEHMAHPKPVTRKPFSGKPPLTKPTAKKKTATTTTTTTTATTTTNRANKVAPLPIPVASTASPATKDVQDWTLQEIAQSPCETMPFSCAAATTSIATAVTAANKHAAMPPPPVVLQPAAGGRCRVRFDQGCDFLGRRDDPLAAGWYPATIVKVTAKTKQGALVLSYSIKLTTQFDDRTAGTYEYPSDRLQLLYSGTEDDDDDHAPVMYTEQGDIFYWERPDSLNVGDLVFGYYQKGWAKDAWFRGRVAHVATLDRTAPPDSSSVPASAAATTKNSSSSISKCCTIAYDDGEYEMQIPYGRRLDNVKLIQKGFKHPTWMEGLTVEMASKKHKISSGVIRTTAANQPVTLEYKGPDGVFTEKRPYKAVAIKLFQSRKPAPENCLQWPTGNIGNDDKNESGRKRKITALETKKATTKKAPPKSCAKQESDSEALIKPTVVKRNRKSQRVTVKKSEPEALETTTEDSDWEDSVEPLSTRKRTRRTRKAAAKESDEPVEPMDAPLSPKARKTRPRRVVAKLQSPEPSEDLPASEIRDDHSSPPKKKRATRKAPAKKAPPKERKAPASRKTRKYEGVIPVDESDFDSDTDSDEIHEIGDASRITELDFSSCNVYGNALNSADTHLGAQLLTFAASFHNQVPNEQLSCALMDLMTYGPKSQGVTFPDSRRMDLAADYLWLLLSKPGYPDKLTGFLKASYWEDCLDQMTSPVYAADGDAIRTSSFAIQRLGQSLHVKVSCAHLFLQLLSRQLKSYTGKNKAEVDIGKLCSLPIVKDLLAHRRGAKEPLEKALKSYTQLWIHYGHFILCDFPDFESEEHKPSNTQVNFVREQATRLLELMGKTCSYLAWLYGVAAHEDANGLAHMMSNVVSREIGETTFDPTPFLKADGFSPEDHWQRVKLQFLLNLDKRSVPQVRPALAGLFDVAKKYNDIFGG